jgi:hypothetical protein
MKITNYKSQITNKSQCPKSQTTNYRHCGQTQGLPLLLNLLFFVLLHVLRAFVVKNNLTVTNGKWQMVNGQLSITTHQ